MNKLKNFLDKFDFTPDLCLQIGVERECFLLDKNKRISPLAPMVLGYLGVNGKFGFELSACQLEDRIGPCHINEIKKLLNDNEILIKEAEKKLGFSRNFEEVGPEDMCLDVFPDPTGRYQKLIKDMPNQVLASACRVIGTHIHVGMPDPENALKVYNRVLTHLPELLKQGDCSQGERLNLYKNVAPNPYPLAYQNWEDFHCKAQKNGFDENPRNCWHLIRISVHGTIEFRMFGATSEITKIQEWAKSCHDLCQAYL